MTEIVLIKVKLNAKILKALKCMHSQKYDVPGYAEKVLEMWSGNLGTSNATILLGLGPGVVVGIHDIGKAAVAVLLAEFFFPQLEYAGAVAGVACVMGHIFPALLKFKGGKGIASKIHQG